MREIAPPETQNYWQGIAQRWNQIGSPLRPNSEDLDFFERALALSVEGRSHVKGVILGVTQELFRLPWPTGSNVMAVDHTPAMIEALWPGPAESAIVAEWTSIPREVDGVDIVMCDGGYHLVSHPIGQRVLVEQLQRILVGGGRFVVRLFALPSSPEAPSCVLRDLVAGEIASMNHLKMRLAMALQENPTEGVELRKVWETLNQAAPDLLALADRLSWAHDHALAVNSYKESENRYSFVSVSEAIAAVCAEGIFELESIKYPEYELGDRCPTLVFRKTA